MRTRILFAVIVCIYPLIVYFGVKHFETRYIALALVVLAAVRWILTKSSDRLRGAMPHANFVIVALVAVGVLGAVTNSATLLQYYPVLMNVLMFVLFFSSLIWPPTVVERIARITTPDLPDAGVVYTRIVTMVWCGFFVLNGAMSFFTIVSTSLGFWAVYNSAVSYTLMGMLFAGEFVVRKRVQRNIAPDAGAKGWS